MKQRNHIYRQGDVLLIRVDSLPKLAARVQEGERIVLAEGEATGHAHALIGDAELHTTAVRPWGGPLREPRFVVIRGGRAASLVHEEHDTITLAPGIYEVRRQREYTPTVIRERWVAD